MLLKKPVELPWAVPKKEGFKGEAPGLYFHYYRTHSEAKKAHAWLVRNKKWTGPIEFREGEAFHAGYI